MKKTLIHFAYVSPNLYYVDLPTVIRKSFCSCLRDCSWRFGRDSPGARERWGSCGRGKGRDVGSEWQESPGVRSDVREDGGRKRLTTREPDLTDLTKGEEIGDDDWEKKPHPVHPSRRNGSPELSLWRKSPFEGVIWHKRFLSEL